MARPAAAQIITIGRTETSVITRLSNPVVAEALLTLELEPDQLGRASISDLELGFSARNAAELAGAPVARKMLIRDICVSYAATRFASTRSVGLPADRRSIPSVLVSRYRSRMAVDGPGVLGRDRGPYDADFDLIASVTGQACKWIVPAGSVD